MMDGIFNVRKPKGMTSHDVVGRMRKILNLKKIGHGGTLDPMAEGVLPVFVGRATRLLEYVLEGNKTYEAVISFGQKTTTGDIEGEVIKHSEIISLKREERNKILQSFTGELKQIPPMYSAIKMQGRKLYDYARKGIEIERKPRDIRIIFLEELSYDEKSLKIRVSCSKGTYIRKLAEDISEAFGMVGTLSFLLRTQVGEFTLENAHSLEEIAENHEKCMLPLEIAIKNLPRLVVNPLQGKRIAQGVPTTIKGAIENILYAVETTDKELVGIAKVKNDRVRAEKILYFPEVTKNTNEENTKPRGTKKE